jgi:hypothetical protein
MLKVLKRSTKQTTMEEINLDVEAHSLINQLEKQALLECAYI